ncbi:MAG: hypothetical protein JRH06_08520 [Deltaproteobacteria bacterium]|nr:hypothetical protein [Deltaproteobacteria bacterium]MBW2137588.1 hypothetical protein [Deltaproteobacteria bacterium]
MSLKKIVVTGSASGIGAESARVIKTQGATLIPCDGGMYQHVLYNMPGLA